MYLSELFLQQLDGDFSMKSVEHALGKCDEEFRSRTEAVSVDEMRAFWDVYKEFDSELCEDVRNSLQILA